MFASMDAAGWDDRYAARELVWSAEPNRFLVEQCADLPVGRVLDLAAGEGRNAIWLARQGWRATAVDFSAVGLDKGRQIAAREGVSVDWRVADVTTYQPQPHAFDLVIVFYLQLQPAQRRAAHRHAAAALAPGGTLLIVGHDLDNLAHGSGGPQDPEVLLTAADVVADLAPCGLTVSVAEQVRRPIPGDPEARPAIDLLVRAVRG
jgi:2-polyprenyl-3-methyl-5-hydroxy-6-metoxy-1,4-benzoquinol methylase